jgi:hypothetical protein
MPILTTPPNRTLAELNEFVGQQEEDLQGSLTAIGNKDGSTTIQINDLDPAGAPTKPSVIITSGVSPREHGLSQKAKSMLAAR